MRAIDTNILVRLLIRDDPGQTGTAEDFVQNGAWISVLVGGGQVPSTAILLAWTMLNFYRERAGVLSFFSSPAQLTVI